MKTLNEHCQKFHAAIFTDHDGVERELSQDLIPAGQLSLNEAFEVYREGYSARAVESLGESYETLWRFLGDDDFFELVEQYIENRPSQNPNISEWGKDLPEFLAENSAGEVLVELARFCRLQTELFHRASREHVIQEMPNLKFQAQFEIFASPIDVLSLWNAIHNDQALESELYEPSQILVYLSDGQVRLARLTVDADFLQALKEFAHNGRLSLDELFSSLPREVSESENLAGEIQTVFQHLRELGLFFESPLNA